MIVIAIGLMLNLWANYFAHTLTTPQIWLRHIIGSPTSFDFPVIEYLIIVLLGIWSATWFVDKEHIVNLKVITLGYGILVANLVLKYSYNFPSIFGWMTPWVNTPVRWPPSLSFLLNGLSFTFVFWSITRWMIKIRQFNFICNILLYVGQRGMGFLIYHLLLLFIMKIANVPLYTELQLMVFVFGIIASYKIFELGLVRWGISRYNMNHEKI